MKIVAVLYPGGSAADNPEVLGCAENVLGLREFLEEQGHELVYHRQGGWRHSERRRDPERHLSRHLWLDNLALARPKQTWPVR